MKQILLALVLLCSPVSAVSVIPISEDNWTCYEHSVNYAKENPEWGIVLLSNNQLFRGQCHYVNYRVVNDTTLEIQDQYFSINYLIEDWKSSDRSYHFCVNEVPKRNWRVMQDNRFVI